MTKKGMYSLTSVHPPTEKFYFWSGCLVFTPDEAVALVDAFYRINGEYLYHLSESCMQPALSSITYTCPTDQSAYSTSDNHSQWMRGRSSACICQDLFHTLICNEVDACTDGISNYVKSASPRLRLVLQLTHVDVNETRSIALPTPGALPDFAPSSRFPNSGSFSVWLRSCRHRRCARPLTRRFGRSVWSIRKDLRLRLAECTCM